MKALVLCGGFGTRLGILGRNVSKPLIEIGKRAVLSRTIDKLDEVDEIDEIVISTNRKFEGDYQKWIKKQNIGKKITLFVEPADSAEKKLGAVAAVDYALREKKISDDLILIMGDNLFSFDLSHFTSQFRRLKTPCHVVYDIGSREKAKLFGVPQVSESLITRVIEKPRHTSSTLVCTGIYFLTVDSLKLISEYLEKSEKKDRLGDFMSWFVERTPVHAFHGNGTWFDIGDSESLKEARRWVEKGG
ncbi:MAG: nucleotidyltransferase family protein [Candidatus Aenigmarchaeota archaeon]|nr:nucleotidyltransferase family protein [Candidatus Aenigmarchaeota archaeon]